MIQQVKDIECRKGAIETVYVGNANDLVRIENTNHWRVKRKYGKFKREFVELKNWIIK